MDDDRIIHAMVKKALARRQDGSSLPGLTESAVDGAAPRVSYEVDYTFGAEEGIELIRQCAQPCYDLILIDRNMPPGMDGMDAIKVIRKMLPAVPIVLITGSSINDPDNLQFLQENAVRLFLKPFGSADFYRLIDEMTTAA